MTFGEMEQFQEGWQKGVEHEKRNGPNSYNTGYRAGLRAGEERIRSRLRELIGVTDFTGSDVE